MTFWTVFKATLAVAAGYAVAVIAFWLFVFGIFAMLWLWFRR
jgi:hypothetical protein